MVRASLKNPYAVVASWLIVVLLGVVVVLPAIALALTRLDDEVALAEHRVVAELQGRLGEIRRVGAADDGGDAQALADLTGQAMHLVGARVQAGEADEVGVGDPRPVGRLHVLDVDATS